MLHHMLANSVRSALLAPYMLAMLQKCRQVHSKSASRMPGACALDIEKFTTCSGIETWPQYADHAARGMSPVVPMLEVGYAGGCIPVASAFQAQET